MQKTSLVSSGLAVGIWLVACTAANNNDTANLTAAGACDANVQTLCNKLQECFPLGLSALYNDVAQCTERSKLSCMNTLGAQGTGATTATLDACTTAFKSATCDVLLGAKVPDACKTPAGTLADGKACGDDAQCTSRYCAKTSDACGQCTARAAVGGACVQSGDCAEGLVCNATGKCAEPGKQGEACSATKLCGTDLICQKGTCDKPLALGATCNPVEPACDQRRGHICGANMTCEAIKLAKTGEPCGFVKGQITSCGAHGKCKLAAGAQSGTCEAPAADGQACDAQKGPGCLAPAKCVKGVCTIADPNACK
jgi:hypothetical protein